MIEKISKFAKTLRELFGDNYIIEDSWTSHGDKPDIHFRDYAEERKWSYTEAMASPIARSIFLTDKHFIDKSCAVIMIQPCGQSAAYELGYAAGTGKRTVIIKDIPKDSVLPKVDMMENFADIISPNIDHFLEHDFITFKHLCERC